MKPLQDSTISLKISNLKFVAEISSSQLTIFQISENQKTVVAKLALKAEYFKFYVKQHKFDITGPSITVEEVGPEFYYQDFAFTALVGDLIYFYYYTEDNELVSMNEKIEGNSTHVVAADCIMGEDLAFFLILTPQNIHILNCQPDFISNGNSASNLEFKTLKKTLQLPVIQDDSSLIKWVDATSFVLYTSAKNGGHHLSYFQNRNDNWTLVNRIEIAPVVVLSAVFEDKVLKNSNLILVGYTDGKVEHLQTPLLNSVDISEALFPGMFALNNIDAFFTEVSFKKLDRPPKNVYLSPNGFTAEFVIGKGKFEMVEKVEFKCKAPIEEKKEDFVNTISSLLFVGFIKNNALEDFKTFLSDLPQSYAKLISNKVCDIFINHVSLEHSLSSSFFAPEVGNVEIDILSLVFFVHRALNPESWACRNAYLMLQIRFVREMFLRACNNPIMAVESLGNSVFTTGNSAQISSDIKQLSKTIEFRIGAYHQLAALVLWVKDFCNLIARHLFIYYCHLERNCESCWVFLLDLECRKIIQEVVTLAKVFQYQLRDVINSNVSQNENLYLTGLERTIRIKKVSLENFLMFLSQADQILLHDEVLETEMHFEATLNDAFLPSITNLELAYQTLQRNLYEMDIGTGFDESLLFTTPRILNRNIDNILLTNIPKGVKLQKCVRCGQETQVEMTIDPAIGRFEASPSWSNSYSESCICGGAWVL